MARLRSMTKLLERARLERYAVAQPVFVNIGMAAAYLSAASELRSPIILGFGTEYLPSSEARDLRHLVRLVEALAEGYDVPVVLHLDHAKTYEACAEAIAAGFTSVMIDGSSLSFEENVKLTRRVAELAHLAGVSVEAELGRLKTGAGYELTGGHDEVLTDPEEAACFAELTGVDALAVSVGTVHGDYEGPPSIRFDLVRELRRTLSVPLVLHGASGTGLQTLSELARLGIAKVNVYTDLVRVAEAEMRRQLDRSRLQMNRFLRAVGDRTRAALAEYIQALGSAGQASSAAE